AGPARRPGGQRGGQPLAGPAAGLCRRRDHLERRLRRDAGDQPALHPPQAAEVSGADSPEEAASLVRETVYGSRLRLEWMLGHLKRDDRIVEVGCGTGYMLCRPLARMGYRVEGLDLDAKSIEHGQELLRQEGLDPSILACRPLRESATRPSVIVASEVLEH